MNKEIKCQLCFSDDVQILRVGNGENGYILEVKCNYCKTQTLTQLYPKKNILKVD